MDLYLKSDGTYKKKELTQDEYLNWFKSNMDDEGNVTEDCMIYKDADLEINTDKSLTFIMSDDSLDRDFERFDTSGWDLKSFKKNPVLLWGHDRSKPAIGIVEETRVKENRLLGNPVFDSEDEFAMKIGGKVERRIIRTGSVGFFPTKIKINDDDKDPCQLTYLKQELREFSICNVPANPNAVVLGAPGKLETINVTVDGNNTFKETVTVPSIYVDGGHGTIKQDMNLPPIGISIKTFENLKDEVEKLTATVEQCKQMVITMYDKVAKEDSYFEEIFTGKTSKPNDGKKLYPEY